MTTSNPTEDNKALVLAGIKGVFIDRDPTVLDRLFSDDYRQHNPQIPNGTAAIKAVLGSLSADFKYQPGLVVADGDYVMVHGHYVGCRRTSIIFLGAGRKSRTSSRSMASRARMPPRWPEQSRRRRAASAQISSRRREAASSFAPRPTRQAASKLVTHRCLDQGSERDQHRGRDADPDQGRGPGMPFLRG
jgi:hypothetical protein